MKAWLRSASADVRCLPAGDMSMAATVQWPGRCGRGGYDSRHTVTWLLSLAGCGSLRTLAAASGPWRLTDAGCSLGAVVTGGPWLQPLGRGSCRTLVAGGR